MAADDSPTNLRSFLSQVAAGGGLTRVPERVSPDLELTEVLWEFEDAGNSDAVLFDQVDAVDGSPSDVPVAVNLFADRRWCAAALDASVEDAGIVYHEREQQSKLLAPERVDRGEAPVAERVETGADVDLSQFPIVTHHEADAGPYLTAGVCIVPSPPGEDWGVNAATLRLQYRGPDEFGLFMVPGRHTDTYFQAYEERGEDMPMAVVLGHHPTFHFGCQTLHAIDVDEYEVVGGVRESPLPLTEAATLADVPIPADAEIVVEGNVKAGERVQEGPFGEYMGYYGEASDDHHLLEVSAVNRREDAIFHDIMPGHADHQNIGAIPLEGRIYDSVKGAVSSVEAVHLPISGNGRNHCYVSIDKREPGQGKRALLAALAPYNLVKHVVVVDDDVDIFDDSEVWWAISSRTQWDEDVVIESGLDAVALDPSGRDRQTVARGGIDATMSAEKDYPLRLERTGLDVADAVDGAQRDAEFSG